MPCYLLHMIEAPNTQPYSDADVKDLVGQYPRLFCAQCTPPQELAPGESVRCLQRDNPCWKPDAPCADAPDAPPNGSDPAAD
jgi:hypothetical protein